jgi:hypothetical protein
MSNGLKEYIFFYKNETIHGEHVFVISLNIKFIHHKLKVIRMTYKHNNDECNMIKIVVDTYLKQLFSIIVSIINSLGSNVPKKIKFKEKIIHTLELFIRSKNGH